MTTGNPFFIRLMVDFADHPKTVELSDRAFRQLIEAWLFAKRMHCDGYLTAAQARRQFDEPVLAELVAVGYVDEREDGYQLHDFTEYQESAEAIEEARRKRAAAGAKGAAVRWGCDSDATPMRSKRAKNATRPTAAVRSGATPPPAETAEPVASAMASAIANASQPDGTSMPYIDIDIDNRTTTTQRPSSTASIEPVKPADLFDVFWKAYPRKVDKIKARAAWARATRKTAPHAIIEGAQRYANDPNREDEFTKHPTSWLNAGAWDNPPLPARGGRRAPDQDFDRTRQLGAELQAAADAYHSAPEPLGGPYAPPRRLEIAQ